MKVISLQELSTKKFFWPYLDCKIAQYGPKSTIKSINKKQKVLQNKSYSST